MTWLLVLKKDDKIPEWLEDLLEENPGLHGAFPGDDFSAQRDENTRRLKEHIGIDPKDEEFSRQLDMYKNKWTELKPEIDAAYTLFWQYANENTRSKSWGHEPTKPNHPYSSPAQFFHFLQRFFDVRRYDRKPHTSDPNRYGYQRYYRKQVSTYPSKEFNRRWKTWEYMSEYGKRRIITSFDKIFEKLGWFEFDVVIKGIGDGENSPPYTFLKSSFKEWRQLQKFLASGKKIPVKFSENKHGVNLDPKRR